MQWEGGRVGSVGHQPLHPDLALLLLAEGRRGQDLPDHPGALRAAEERVVVVRAEEPVKGRNSWITQSKSGQVGRLSEFSRLTEWLYVAVACNSQLTGFHRV